MAGRDGVLSARAEAGKEASIPIVVTNTGTAPADEIELTSSAPSGWKISFEPKTIDRIAPGQNKEVQALVTPPEKAIAGDYAPTFNVASRGETASHPVPRRGRDLDHVGHRRRRHHRDRAADHGGRGGEVRPAMSDTVIEARDLTKRYGKAAAVDGVSFTVGRGEIFGLLGPNGAGKTTTILMMLGLTDVTGGSVSVLGHDPAREPLQVKRAVGYLPDTVGFYDHMTAGDNLRYTAALIGIEPAEREQAHRGGARPRRPRRRRRQARRRILARHAPAARSRRNPDEGRRRSPSSTSRPRASIRRPPPNCWT